MELTKIKSGFRRSFPAVIVLILILTVAGCSVNGRYKKHKAVPCPCETERRR